MRTTKVELGKVRAELGNSKTSLQQTIEEREADKKKYLDQIKQLEDFKQLAEAEQQRKADQVKTNTENEERLKEEIERLKKKFSAQVRREIAYTNDSEDDWAAQIRTLKRELEKTKEALRIKEIQLSRANDGKDYDKKKSAEYQAEIASLNKRVFALQDDSRKEIVRLKTELSESKSIIEKLDRTVQLHRRTLDRQHDKLDEAHTQVEEELAGSRVEVTQLKVELAHAKADLKQALDDSQSNKKRADQLQAAVVEYKQRAETQTRQQAQQVQSPQTQSPQQKPQQPPETGKTDADKKEAAARTSAAAGGGASAAAGIGAAAGASAAAGAAVDKMQKDLDALKAQNEALQRELKILKDAKEMKESQEASRSETLKFAENQLRENAAYIEKLNADLQAANTELAAKNAQFGQNPDIQPLYQQWTAQFLTPLQHAIIQRDAQISFLALEIEKLQKAQNQYKVKEELLTGHFTAKEAELLRLKFKYDGLQREYAEQVRRIKNAEDGYNGKEENIQKIKVLEGIAKELQNELHKEERKFRDKAQKLAETEVVLARDKENHIRLEVLVQETAKQLSTTTTQLAQSKNQNTRLEAVLQKNIAEYYVAQNALRETVKQLNDQLLALKNDLATSEVRCLRLNTEVLQQKRENEGLIASNANLMASLRAYSSAAPDPVFFVPPPHHAPSPPSFTPGVAVVGMPIPPNMPVPTQGVPFHRRPRGNDVPFAFPPAAAPAATPAIPAASPVARPPLMFSAGPTHFRDTPLTRLTQWFWDNNALSYPAAGASAAPNAQDTTTKAAVSLVQLTQQPVGNPHGRSSWCRNTPGWAINKITSKVRFT